jgi:hypothetical protein
MNRNLAEEWATQLTEQESNAFHKTLVMLQSNYSSPRHVHELKILPQYFNAIVEGVKTFEVRKNDRNYQVGDILYLREYDFLTFPDYTGREVYVKVTYILSDPEYVKEGYVVMAIKPITV